MISSMTGYAAEERSTNYGILLMELRSVNHRYLELQLKIEDSLRSFESSIRTLLQDNLGRGKVDCRIALKQGESSGQLGLNHAVVREIAEHVKQVAEHFDEVQPVNLLEVLRMPGVMQSPQVDMAALESNLISGLQSAIEELKLAKQREGDKLKAILLARLSDIEVQIQRVKPLMPRLLEAYQAKLMHKLQEAMAADEERVRQEIVLYAQRIDVDEELSRLETHVQEVRRILDVGGLVGKRLDFLMQEMNREANTLGSKSVAIETTQVSMQLKVLIEQMREQIQNIE